MEKIITYENLHHFAYSNDKLIEGEIRGIVLHFYGLGCTDTYSTAPGDAAECATHGILFLIPYCSPWSWMNRQTVALVDEIIDVIREHYGLDESVKIVSTGGSMGGLCALVYTAYARITPCACVTNCPVCDLVYHYTERPDLPRTLYSAFSTYEGTLQEAMQSASPLHLVDRMPHVPYTVFHCEADRLVNLQKHSLAFVEAMQPSHDITLHRVPHAGHCDLPSSARAVYLHTIIDSVLGRV